MADVEMVMALSAVIHGDAHAISGISEVRQVNLLSIARSIGEPLMVERSATVKVLRDFIEGRITPSECQAWASFVRRGFTVSVTDPSIMAIRIEFENAYEDAIAVAVSRLDEIGDVIDGEVAVGEALDLLQLLGEP